MTGLVWLDVAGLAALAVALTAAARDGRRARQGTACDAPARERIAREVAAAFGNDWEWCTEGMRELYRADADRALQGPHPAPPVTDTEPGRDA